MREAYSIEEYFFEWVDDFAAARNVSFSKMNTDWILWMDSDDTIEDAADLRTRILDVADDVGAIWLPYVYSTDEYGTPTTLHDKERLLRRSVGWEWSGRLHEGLDPQSFCKYERGETPVWLHHDAEVGSEDHGERNLRILQKWMVEEPNNIRIWYFMGNQFFADDDYSKAAWWYTKFAKFITPGGVQGSPHDRWGALSYAARALREIGRLDEACQADLAAMYIFPDWADSYVGMGESMFRKGEYEKAISWLHTAMQKDTTDRVMFMNVLDYTWRIQNILNACYAATGDYEGAAISAAYALEVRPNDSELRHNHRTYGHIIDAQKEAKRRHVGLENNPLRTVKRFKNPFTSQLEEVRDIVAPALLKKARAGTQPSIAFFTGESMAEWYAETPNKEGIGGSETAVIEITKRLAQKGFKPVIYGKPGSMEGEYDGVLYLSWKRWRPSDQYDHFVSWRNPRIALDNQGSEHLYLWAHDLNYDKYLSEEIGGLYDKILPVSDWHGRYLEQWYPFLKGKTLTMPNGIDLARSKRAKEKFPVKQPWRIVWASSPDRGLRNLLDIWPIIRTIEPAAELHVYYGFENLEKQMLEGSAVSKWIIESVSEGLKQDGVYSWGKVDQETLAEEFQRAEMWLYPTSFLETSCITAVEAMAADLLCVTSASGNLPDILGEAGVCVPGHANTWNFQDKYLDMVTIMMQDFSTRLSYRGVGPKRAKKFTWDKAVKPWLQMLDK